MGGLGSDRLDGGAGIDRAQYSQAASGVRADLRDVATNTGEAAGDTYVAIENLLGSRFNDVLLGDAGANTLYGRRATMSSTVVSAATCWSGVWAMTS